MAWLPAAAKLVVNVAVPSRPTGALPRTTELPSRNVTVPVGTPAPGATTPTVAVKVPAWPAAAGLTDELRPSVVEARLTVRDASPRLSEKLPVPANDETRSWLPTPRFTFMVACPVLPIRAVPRTVVPSRKVTVPVGTPASDVTVVVSVTD